MRPFLKKFKDGFSKTSQNIWQTSRGLLTGRKLDADSIEELEEALYSADFGVETTTEIIEEIQKAVKKERDLRGQDVAAIGSEILKRVLRGSEGKIEPAAEKPTVICLIGVNGSGKTTTCAKLAHRLTERGNSVIMGACDTFRAAANEQIRSWSERLDIDLVASHHGADAAAVAFDTWQAGKNRGKDYILLDTAGRLHTKSNLMERSEEHTSELQSRGHLVCRLLLEKKKTKTREAEQ